MKSFGVDAEWIPGEERRHRLKMTAMKPSGNHTSVASVAGRRRRSAESARAACPRRWVGSRAPGGGWSRGVASPPLLLVATILLFRVQGCEEGSKSAVCVLSV